VCFYLFEGKFGEVKIHVREKEYFSGYGIFDEGRNEDIRINDYSHDRFL
jgi:hypothetical protein